MIDLLADCIDAHGGLARWHRFSTVTADLVSGGELLDRKAPQGTETRYMTVALHAQYASLTPFGSPDRRSSFRPERVAIETLDGEVVVERETPRAAFEHDDLHTVWDPLQRAYFNGYALWSYLTAPFSFSMPETIVEEIAPIEDRGERWRGLRVTMPARIATHSPVQNFYFGDDLLLRRQDYTVDIAGGFKAANYATNIVEVEGLKLPATRRAYMCDADHRPLMDRLMISIDLSNIAFR